MDRIFSYNKEASLYSYKIENFDSITTDDYFEAVDKSLEDIFSEMSSLNLTKIAVCLSGIDGEVIGRRLTKYNKHVEYFFLHIEGINDEHKKIAEAIASKHDVKLNVVPVSFDFILNEFSKEVFEFCQVTMATYISIPYLIKSIPSDYYIIVGEGDLEKSNAKKYRKIFDDRVTKPSTDLIYVPMHLTEIIYRLSLNHYNKHGESNFYSRKFDTWYHVLRDHRLITNYRFYYDPKADFIYEICGKDFISPIKTLNYTFSDHWELMKTLHQRLESTAAENWSFFIGDVVTIPKDLVF